MKKNRYHYIDNIKFLVVVLVILVHANVTYGNIGGWYYIEKAHLNDITKALSGLFGAFNQAFFMGIMFLFVGYFTPSSYDKKGFNRFLYDKIIRLGVPTLIYVFFINPVNLFIIEKFINNKELDARIFSELTLAYYKNIVYTGGTGPLWFAQTVLVFSIVYAIVRKVGVKFGNAKTMPKQSTIFKLVPIVSLFVFGVRIWQPIGSSIFNLQFCFFVLYIIFFITGLYAYRNDWFNKWNYENGKKALNLGLYIGIPSFFLVMVAAGALKDTKYIMGGFHWQSYMYSLWETFVAISMCIGLTVVFREKFNFGNKTLKILTDNTFGIYVFHAPFLIGISAALKNLELLPLVKFLLASFFTFILTLCFSHIIRKIPKFGTLFN